MIATQYRDYTDNFTQKGKDGKRVRVNVSRYQEQSTEYNVTYQLTILSKFYPKNRCKTKQYNKFNTESLDGRTFNW